MKVITEGKSAEKVAAFMREVPGCSAPSSPSLVEAPVSSAERTASAPGKVVLSGNYSVLWGATSLVAAVDRYAVADPSRPPTHIAEEVLAAVALGFVDAPCFVDVSSLRAPTADGGSRKLGLGSSAAITVATLAAKALGPALDKDELWRRALRAHRQVQPDGSGIDVVASTFGGIRACRMLESGELDQVQHELPPDLWMGVVASNTPSSTAGMLKRVKAFASANPALFGQIIGRAKAGAAATAEAKTSAHFIAGLELQDEALRALAESSGAGIFTAEFDHLARAARAAGAFFAPSGAGGGDIGIYFSPGALERRLFYRHAGSWGRAAAARDRRAGRHVTLVSPARS